MSNQAMYLSYVQYLNLVTIIAEKASPRQLGVFGCVHRTRLAQREVSSCPRPNIDNVWENRAVVQ